MAAKAEFYFAFFPFFGGGLGGVSLLNLIG